MPVYVTPPRCLPRLSNDGSNSSWAALMNDRSVRSAVVDAVVGFRQVNLSGSNSRRENPRPSLLPLPPPSRQSYKWTALIRASANGHTAAVEAIVAADPHPDHIRMTDVRSAGRGERSVEGGG